MNREKQRLQVISRKSPLAILQAREAFSFFPELAYSLSTLESWGDTQKQVSLMDAVPPDFFTRELDQRLIGHQADVAVHSAKDLPYPLPAELEVFALLEATDQTDALVSKNNLTLEQLPAGARVGTSSAARKDELIRFRPDLEVLSIRGTIDERINLVDQGVIDALIVASCALKRLGREGRSACILPFRTHPLQGHLAITGRKDRPEIKALFAAKDIRRNYGPVSIVGFGPGNPDLLTLAGHRALAEAEAIFYDDLLPQDCLAAFPGAKIAVGKRKDKHRFSQDQINEQVYRSAIAGRRTVRLKGGDPMLFAHGREDIDYLQSRLVDVDVVPGITSAIALAACTHIPLTHRGVASSVAFVTGHAAGADLQLPTADTLVCYMGGAHAADMARNLIAAGRENDTPVALVYNVSLPDQTVQFSTLGELRHSVIKYPTPILIVVGQVVSFENHASPRQNVLATGTSEREYADAYPHLTHTPLIWIRKIKENSALYDALKTVRLTIDWVVFTSRYGVRYFFEAVNELKLDLRAFYGVQFASVGETTSAELRRHGIYPDLEPDVESAEGLVACFEKRTITQQRILLPRSDKGLKYLPDALQRLGNTVVDIPVYRNVANTDAGKVDLAQFQKILFASPSGVEAFTQLYGELPSGTQLIAKGDTTEKTLISHLYATI
jgi:uroporphyrinogen III methyltransferase/synthase